MANCYLCFEYLQFNKPNSPEIEKPRGIEGFADAKGNKAVGTQIYLES